MTQRTAYPIVALVEAVRRQSAGRLAQELVGPFEGVCVRSIGALSHAKPDEVAFLANSKYIGEVKDCQAGVVVLRQEGPELLSERKSSRNLHMGNRRRLLQDLLKLLHSINKVRTTFFGGQKLIVHQVCSEERRIISFYEDSRLCISRHGQNKKL